MADNIRIKLPDIFEPITDADVSNAKKWTQKRNQNADKLAALIQTLLQDAIRDLVRIGYRYNVKPEDFQFSQNKELQKEVYALMDKLEDDIFELIEAYSLNESDDKKRQSTLLPWLLALKSKGADNLRDTLGMRLRQFLYDTEAQIASMLITGKKLTDAITRSISTMHAVYTAPEVKASFGKGKAMYLRSGGVHSGGQGLSSSGSVNVENLGRQTATMAWMKSQLIGFEQDGAVAYYQLRGSSYPCDICDEEVGIHYGDILNDPYPHAHCMCYRIPLKPKDEEGYTTKKVYKNGGRVRLMDNVEKEKSDYKDLMNIARDFARQGKDATILERIHYKDERYSKVFGSLTGTKYEKKCPDLLIDGKFYEYESFQRPWSKKKVGTMMKHGLAQSPNIIIDNNSGASDRYIRKILMNKINQGVRVDELWIYEKGRIRPFYIGGVFL